MQWNMVKDTYLPWGVSLVLCIFFGIISKKPKMAAGFCVVSLIALLIGLMPTVFNLLTRP
jgi:hypothetical protein